MTTEEMLAALAAHGVTDPASKVYLRAEPEGEHPGDRVFRTPVQLADGRYLVVSWSFGQPSDDAMDDWVPAWRSVDGPMTRAQVIAGG